MIHATRISHRFRRWVVALSGVLSACASTAVVTPPARSALPTSLCDRRVRGAEIVIDVGDTSLRLWSTNGPFIDKAIDLLRSGKTQNALFSIVEDGTDCDPRWTWHVDAAHMSWPDLTMDACNGRPIEVESDKYRWMARIREYCPANVRVRSVDDRRKAAPVQQSGGPHPATPPEIEEEARRQQSVEVPAPLRVVVETQKICAREAVEGWVKVDDEWDPATCGLPLTPTPNVWTIAHYDTLPVGAVVTACMGSAPPGWVVLHTSWNPTRCGAPSAVTSNIMTMRRLR